jgi:AcrR family transcriptional regulator
MASTRRIGKEGSETRARLLDAAERLMVAEGYAALSSRRIAAEAGLKPALVHYYFQSMDDLIVALFRRGAAQSMERLEQASESARPLREMWRLASEQRGALLLVEFAALSRRRPAVRAEISAWGERHQQLQMRTLRAALDRLPDDAGVTAGALSVLMTGLSVILTLEREVGLREGHDEALALVERALDALEPDTEPSGAEQGPDVADALGEAATS